VKDPELSLRINKPSAIMQEIRNLASTPDDSHGLRDDHLKRQSQKA
jgi:hypothetical protein